jgi:hypothetical protein
MISSARKRVAGAPARDRDVPLGFNVAGGSAVVVVSALVSAVVPLSAGAVRLGLFALALGLFAARTVDPLAVVLVGVIAFGVFDGFLVNQLGELAWHGAADVSRLWVLMATAVCGLVAGTALRGARRARLWRGRQEQIQAWARNEQIETWAQDVPVALTAEWKGEERRDA